MRALKESEDAVLLCPQCGDTLPVRPPCRCGFVLRETDGVLDFMTAAESAVVQPFLDAYERVRSKEQWGGDDLDLPFHPKRHKEIWNIRRRTFLAFKSVTANSPRGLALDVGAGNGWMTRYLDQWGFDPIAVDINTSPVDGLRAGQKFIDQGAVFLRIHARMERLPFRSGRIRLLATNASFHYASDFRAVFSEFERVLTPGGMIAIIDTPFYENASDGERMMAGRVIEFWEKYGISEAKARKSSYMTYEELQSLADPLGLKVHIHRVWPGIARRCTELRGKITRRRAAEFPLVILEKA